MNGSKFVRPAALAAFGVLAAVAALHTTAATGNSSATPAASVTPVVLPLPTRPPQGAVVLFSGKADDLRNHWVRRNSQEAPNWVVSGGVASPRRVDMTSKQEFGDQYIHVEFRTPEKGDTNAGVGIQGRYEIQILGDYGRGPGDHGSGSLYSQRAPRVNASKRNGEWQTYDILFRAPRFSESGEVTERARATVFQNGILVQNNEEFRGPTGIQYGEFRGEAKTGPLVLQGDHGAVQFRNIWVVPL